MPQISKHIPIQGHASIPSVLTLQDYAMMEGKAYILSAFASIPASTSYKAFWRTTGSKPYKFKISTQAMSQAGAIMGAVVTEMPSVTTPSVWSGFTKNMNRLYSNSSTIEVGGYAADGTPKDTILSGTGVAFNMDAWYEANIAKYYGLTLSNHDIVNAVYYGFQIYFIEGTL